MNKKTEKICRHLGNIINETRNTYFLSDPYPQSFMPSVVAVNLKGSGLNFLDRFYVKRCAKQMYMESYNNLPYTTQEILNYKLFTVQRTMASLWNVPCFDDTFYKFSFNMQKIPFSCFYSSLKIIADLRREFENSSISRRSVAKFIRVEKKNHPETREALSALPKKELLKIFER